MPEASRSTPAQHKDLAIVTDARGKEWIYSEPADVWHLLDGVAPAPWSARSWHRLAYEFGPLR
jgi:hypothetical protein